MKKEDIYKIGLFASNFMLVIAVLLFLIELIASLLGEKIFLNALFTYASWIGFAAIAKILFTRVQKKERIRASEYIWICIFLVINFIFKYPYPINLILSFLSIIITIYSYRVQQNKIRSPEL